MNTATSSADGKARSAFRNNLPLFIILVFAILGFIGLRAAAGGFESFKEKAISKAEDAVKSRLKDPSSATFASVFLVYGPTTGVGQEIYTCGYVNARNSFGAMAGATRFVVQQYESEFNGEKLVDTYEAAVEEPTTDVQAGDQSSFDMIYWSKCRGQPVPDDG